MLADSEPTSRRRPAAPRTPAREARPAARAGSADWVTLPVARRSRQTPEDDQASEGDADRRESPVQDGRADGASPRRRRIHEVSERSKPGCRHAGWGRIA
jgi:hypothetical protein